MLIEPDYIPKYRFTLKTFRVSDSSPIFLAESTVIIESSFTRMMGGVIQIDNAASSFVICLSMFNKCKSLKGAGAIVYSSKSDFFSSISKVSFFECDGIFSSIVTCITLKEDSTNFNQIEESTFCLCGHNSRETNNVQSCTNGYISAKMINVSKCKTSRVSGTAMTSPKIKSVKFSNFDRNTQESCVLYYKFGTNEAYYCALLNNTQGFSETDPGLIAVRDDATLNVSNSDFRENTGFLFYAISNSFVTVTNSFFEENEQTSSGIIVLIVNSTNTPNGLPFVLRSSWMRTRNKKLTKPQSLFVLALNFILNYI